MGVLVLAVQVCGWEIANSAHLPFLLFFHVYLILILASEYVLCGCFAGVSSLTQRSRRLVLAMQVCGWEIANYAHLPFLLFFHVYLILTLASEYVLCGCFAGVLQSRRLTTFYGLYGLYL